MLFLNMMMMVSATASRVELLRKPVTKLREVMSDTTEISGDESALRVYFSSREYTEKMLLEFLRKGVKKVKFVEEVYDIKKSKGKMKLRLTYYKGTGEVLEYKKGGKSDKFYLRGKQVIQEAGKVIFVGDLGYRLSLEFPMKSFKELIGLKAVAHLRDDSTRAKSLCNIFHAASRVLGYSKEESQHSKDLRKALSEAPRDHVCPMYPIDFVPEDDFNEASASDPVDDEEHERAMAIQRIQGCVEMLESNEGVFVVAHLKGEDDAECRTLFIDPKVKMVVFKQKGFRYHEGIRRQAVGSVFSRYPMHLWSGLHFDEEKNTAVMSFVNEDNQPTAQWTIHGNRSMHRAVCAGIKAIWESKQQ